MFKFKGRTYILDFKKIFAFLDKYMLREQSTSEILDNYEIGGTDSLKVTAKAVRDYKSPGINTVDNVYYDLIRSQIDLVMTAQYYDTQTELPFGLTVALNTLIKLEFLIETKDGE